MSKKHKPSKVIGPSAVYKTLKKVLESRGYDYDSDDENMFAEAIVHGDDLDMKTIAFVDDDFPFLVLSTQLDIDVSKKNYSKATDRLNDINKTLMFGRFFLDKEEGKIQFRYTEFIIRASNTVAHLNMLLEMVLRTTDRHDGELKEFLGGKSNSFDSFYK